MNTTVAPRAATVAPIEARSIFSDMATRFGMDRAAFESTIMKTIMPANVAVTREHVAAFLVVAKHYDLNPFTKEIFAFPAKSGGVQPVVSIDGWLKIINSHPQFDGMEFQDSVQDGKLVAVTCRMYRRDRSHPIDVTEYMSECKRGTDTWGRWPARMLRHKATIQAARYAFGFSGIIDPDEAERALEVESRPQAASVQPLTGMAGLRRALAPDPAPAEEQAPEQAPAAPSQEPPAETPEPAPAKGKRKATAPAEPADAAPAPRTYAVVAGEIHAAETAEALDTLRTEIRAAFTGQQQAELLKLADDRQEWL